MYQRAASQISIGLDEDENVNFRVAVVACLIIAADYAITFGVVPILPMYFEAINLFDVQPSFSHDMDSLIQSRAPSRSSSVLYIPQFKLVNTTHPPVPAAFAWEKKQIFYQRSHNWAVGIVVSTKWAVQMIVCPFVGKFVDRHGVRWPAAFGLLMEVAFCLLFVMADNLLMFVLARAVQGLASAFVVTSMISWLNLSYSVDTRKSFTGWVFATLDLGFALGPPVICTLYGLFGMVRAMLCQIFLFATLFVAFICLCASHKQSTLYLASSEHQGSGSDRDTDRAPGASGVLLRLLCERRMLCLVVQFIVVDWALTSWAPILPVFMFSELHITSAFVIGNIWLVTIVPSLVAVRLVLFLIKTVPNLVIYLAFSAFLLLAGTVVMTCYATTTIWILVLWLAIVSFLSSGMLYVLNSALIELLDSYAQTDGQSKYGAGLAIQELSLSLGCVLAPLISCSVMSMSGYTTVTFLIASLYGICALCVLPIRNLLRTRKWHDTYEAVSQITGPTIQSNELTETKNLLGSSLTQVK